MPRPSNSHESRAKTAAKRHAPLTLHADRAPGSAPGAAFTLAGFAAIAAYAIAVLAIQLRAHPVGDVFTETDFYGAYAEGARLIQHGRLDPSRYGVIGPVYEVALAITGALFRDLYTAAQALSLAGMIITLWAWQRLWTARANAATACAGVALLVVNGQFLRWGYSVTTDALALALQSLALLALLGRTLTPRRAAAAGAIAALAFLTRYSAIALLPAGLLAVLAGGTDTPRERRREVALAFAAGFAGLVLPWMAYSFASGARMTFQLHHNIAYEVFARSRGIAWDTYQREMQPQFPTPWSVLARDPAAVCARMALNVVEHFRLDAEKVAGWPLAAAALAGVVLAWRDGALKRFWPVLAAAALTFLALVPAFHSERYSLPLLPVWVTCAALAFSSPLLALAMDAGGGRRVWLKALLIALPMALAVRESVALQRRTLALLPVEARTLALETRGEFRPGDKVIARKPHFAFYAGLTPVPFPFADSLSQIAAVAREQGVRWLYFSWPEAEMRPAVSFLLDTASAVPGLRVVRAVQDHPAVLYEILPGFGPEPGWFVDNGIRELHRARAQLLIDRTNWRARVYVALYERRLEHWEAAQRLLDEALPWAGEDPELLLLTADNLAATGSPGAARAMLDRAEPLVGADPRVALTRGWIAAVDNDPAGAARWWRPLIEYTDDVRTLLRMHDVFAAVKDGAAQAAVDAKLRARGLKP